MTTQEFTARNIYLLVGSDKCFCLDLIRIHVLKTATAPPVPQVEVMPLMVDVKAINVENPNRNRRPKKQ